MSEEIFINVTPQETRVAVVENGVLQELHIERTRSHGIVGNIYKGKVARILPGMQAAFVDIGLSRAAFLHASDCRFNSEGGNHSVGHPPINELLHEGEHIVVQVAKDPLGNKGARLTMNVTLPARYLVYMPFSKHIGISQKIESEEERERLRELVKVATGGNNDGGYILRTMAETATETELQTDVRYLRRAWSSTLNQFESAVPCTLIRADLPLAVRAIRDLARNNVEKIRIDSRETSQAATAFARDFIPEMEGHIEYYPGERPIFDLYSIEDEIQRGLMPRVPLKSGGYLIIDQTEAMTTIDVNTGTYVGRRTLEETLFKTNLEAAQAIARQLRLRNIGGIIIIDFIDMEDATHRRQVVRALEKVLSRDRTKVYIAEMSTLGLVELTRKRTRESLEHILCEPCPVCSGRGTMRTAHTVCYEVFREILREARQFEANEYLVLASQVVIDMLLDEEADGLGKLQKFIGKPINLQVEPLYHQEQFDVVLM